MSRPTAAASGVNFSSPGKALRRVRRNLSGASLLPVRSGSLRHGQCEAGFWKATSRQEVQKIIRAAENYDRAGRGRGARNGPLGSIALELLTLFGNLVHHRTGRLEPSLEWIMGKLKRSKDAVVRAMKALRDHGFLDWLRRFAPVVSDGAGPQVRQCSNAYRLSAPARALALLGRWRGKPALPDDHQDDVADRRRIEADHAATLDLAGFARFKIEDDPLARALETLGSLIKSRESVQRTESQSTSYPFVPIAVHCRP